VTISEGEREVLLRLRNLMSQLGSANDALDRGYDDQGRRMQADSLETVASLLAAHPWIDADHPDLGEALRSPMLTNHVWSSAEDLIDALLG
jgi:hypothetical protein